MLRMIIGAALLSRGRRLKTRTARLIVNGTGTLLYIDAGAHAFEKLGQRFTRSSS